MTAEMDAMGGAEGELLPVGDLHGDWLLADGETLEPILAFQLSHAKGEAEARAGYDFRSKRDWFIGSPNPDPELNVTRDAGGALDLVLNTSAGALPGKLQAREIGYSGSLERPGKSPLNIVMVRPIDLDTLAMNREDASGVQVPLEMVAVDEAGNPVTGSAAWTFELEGAGDIGEMFTDNAVAKAPQNIGEYRVSVEVTTPNGQRLDGSLEFTHNARTATRQFITVLPVEGEQRTQAPATEPAPIKPGQVFAVDGDWNRVKGEATWEITGPDGETFGGLQNGRVLQFEKPEGDYFAKVTVKTADGELKGERKFHTEEPPSRGGRRACSSCKRSIGRPAGECELLLWG